MWFSVPEERNNKQDCLTKEKTENMITKCLKSQIVVFMGKSWEKKSSAFQRERRKKQSKDWHKKEKNMITKF